MLKRKLIDPGFKDVDGRLTKSSLDASSLRACERVTMPTAKDDLVASNVLDKVVWEKVEGEVNASKLDLLATTSSPSVRYS